MCCLEGEGGFVALFRIRSEFYGIVIDLGSVFDLVVVAIWNSGWRCVIRLYCR